MKEARVKKKTARIRLPRASATYTELADFFDRHDGIDLLDRGITEIDPDGADLDRMRFGPLPSPSRLIITDSCAWHRQIQGLIAGRIRPAMM